MPPKREAAEEPAGAPAAQTSSAGPKPKPTSNKKGPGSRMIAGFEAMTEEERLDMIAKADRLMAEADAFRRGSLATQHKQDVHLRYYQAYLRITNQLKPDASDTDIDAIAWPVDHEKLCKQLKGFLVFMFANVKGRGLSSNVIYDTLSQCRESMRFWALRSCGDLSDPDYKMSKDGMTETMNSLRNK